MGRATEDQELWMCRFSEDQWLNNVDKLVNETITSDVQALMVVESDQEVKFDQETLITDVKNTLAVNCAMLAVKVNRVVNRAVLKGRATCQKSHR